MVCGSRSDVLGSRIQSNLASSSFLPFVVSCTSQISCQVSSSLLLWIVHSELNAAPSIPIGSYIINGLLAVLIPRTRLTVRVRNKCLIEVYQHASTDVTASTISKLHLTVQWRVQHSGLSGSQQACLDHLKQPQHSSSTTRWHWSQS